MQLTVKPIIGYLNPIQINQFGDRPAIRAIVFISGPENTHQVHIHKYCIIINTKYLKSLIILLFAHAILLLDCHEI